MVLAAANGLEITARRVVVPYDRLSKNVCRAEACLRRGTTYFVQSCSSLLSSAHAERMGHAPSLHLACAKHTTIYSLFTIHCSRFTVLCSLLPVLTITRSACRKCSARGSFYAFFSYFGIPRQLRERCALLPRMKHDTGVSVPTRLVVLAVTCFFSLPLLLT